MQAYQVPASPRNRQLGELLRLLKRHLQRRVVLDAAPLIERFFPEVAVRVPGFDRILANWPRRMARVIGTQMRFFDSGESPSRREAKLQELMAALYDPPSRLPAAAGVPATVIERAKHDRIEEGGGKPVPRKARPYI